MKILHYFLGFPPYRTGGLTKFATDLMKTQVADNHEVFGVWPGSIKRIGGKPSIKRRASVEGIHNYEVLNPLPVSLDEGIVDFEAYTKACNQDVYESFLLEHKPDVMHIHTMMGLHREFVMCAERLGIRTVFTSHDYYGICPKVTLYRYGVACEEDHMCTDCVSCNNTALSLRKIQFMQSKLYRLLKNTPVVRTLRKQHRENFFEFTSETRVSGAQMEGLAEQYQNLRKYYIEMLEHIDVIHFNSRLCEAVYKKYMTPKSSKVITITHCEIEDNRFCYQWEMGEKIQITCLAPPKPYKGFLVLKEALDQIWNMGKHDFELRLFGSVPLVSPYMKIREEGYSYSQLGEILSKTDVLVAPSVWYETFGFTVLEAISYGVPVIVSDHVGAKDIVGDGGIVVEAGSVESLKCAIESLSKECIEQLRTNIVKHAEIKTWSVFADEILCLYK